VTAPGGGPPGPLYAGQAARTTLLGIRTPAQQREQTVYPAGAISITVTSGRAQNLTRRAPPSMPIPRFT